MVLIYISSYILRNDILLRLWLRKGIFTLEACNIVISLTCLSGLKVKVYVQQQVACEPIKQQELWLRTCDVSSRNQIFALCLVMV